ncbi:MAG: cellulase family glycosylhydrolase [Sphingobacteriia bacterium]|nr:cellulase family glycosylhydrolase [Sphingobacteriia bacterium]
MSRNHLKLAGYIICIALFAACKKETAADQSPNVNPSGTDINLSKGINLSNWFNDYSDPAQFPNRFTTAHFQKIKQLGFTFVRIPIGSTILFQSNNPSVLNPYNLALVDAAVKRATDQGLAVIINFHPYTEDFETKLMQSTNAVADFTAYWKSLVNYFKKYSPAQVCFEIFNEPHLDINYTAGNSWWWGTQKQIINGIRSIDSAHYIIAGGEDWNSIAGLAALQPYAQKNIVYNFHFYDPFTFTHQGASWAGAPYDSLKNIPYPSSPQSIAPILRNYNDPDILKLLNWYGDCKFNGDSLSSHIMQAVGWANSNNVRLMCNEFGSYKVYAPANARVKFINDVRAILEKNNIGWAMWECDEGFGFMSYPNTSDRNIFITDNDVLKALGLL